MYDSKELLVIRNPLYAPDDDTRKPDEMKSVPRLLRVYVTWGGWEKPKGWKWLFCSTKHWIFHVQFGRGAGYILGREFYVARNVKVPAGSSYEHPSLSRRASLIAMHVWYRIRRLIRLPASMRMPLVIGFTQNANYIPYSDG